MSQGRERKDYNLGIRTREGQRSQGGKPRKLVEKNLTMRRKSKGGKFVHGKEKRNFGLTHEATRYIAQTYHNEAKKRWEESR